MLLMSGGPLSSQASGWHPTPGISEAPGEAPALHTSLSVNSLRGRNGGSFARPTGRTPQPGPKKMPIQPQISRLHGHLQRRPLSA